MKIKLYNEKQSYTVMKLDAMLQKAEILGSCDFNEFQTYIVEFRKLPIKAQEKYENLMESMMELYSEEEQELC
tara:strand:- start:510 stop:728 length:219 start_codon:yes stop_codon:yes gene_type:complete